MRNETRGQSTERFSLGSHQSNGRVPPTPMSQAFMDRAERYQPSIDPDEAARETIQLMTDHIKSSARDPLFQGETQHALQRYMPMALASVGGMSLRDQATKDQAKAFAIWWWAKHNLEFVHHSQLILVWLGERDQLQLLISPDVIVKALYCDDAEARGRARKGDCAVFSPMIAAMLESAGLDWELVIGAVDPNQPEIFTHIWPRVILSDGRRVSLDASHGKYPGWHVPAPHINRLQVWDSNGRAVADRGNTFAGLHNYVQRGLGICDEAGNCYDEATGNMVGGSSSANLANLYPAGFPSSGSSSGGSGSSFNWGPTISSLLNSWTQIGAKVIAPTTTYTVGPNGQIQYSTPGAAPAPTGISTSLGSGTLGWVVGGGLALLVVVSLLGGKK